MKTRKIVATHRTDFVKEVELHTEMMDLKPVSCHGDKYRIMGMNTKGYTDILYVWEQPDEATKELAGGQPCIPPMVSAYSREKVRLEMEHAKFSVRVHPGSDHP